VITGVYQKRAGPLWPEANVAVVWVVVVVRLVNYFCAMFDSVKVANCFARIALIRQELRSSITELLLFFHAEEHHIGIPKITKKELLRPCHTI
jgi:hypothetical protein